ncbi:hypothetical protein Q0F99_05165 [Rathayibacter oskolensis]|uniref:hypothetical protein n=1 Tax=Rathayibacter oskolensis TaxID=1891671 RepID=UPI00265DA84E|nr:hypothetical protein [Rathayibacter oskolensis]WKK72367.1 hypothetical protein Q0F99_05165 [Rathayibacter oskolensis]
MTAIASGIPQKTAVSPNECRRRAVTQRARPATHPSRPAISTGSVSGVVNT